MTAKVRVGIIGDRDPSNPSRQATGEALAHAARALGVSVDAQRLPTDTLKGHASGATRSFDTLLCSPGSPHGSLDGAPEAVRVAREDSVPFIGTCGGFQRAVVEYARNVFGVGEAGHAEHDPTPPWSLCLRVGIVPGSKALKAHVAATTGRHQRADGHLRGTDKGPSNERRSFRGHLAPAYFSISGPYPRPRKR